MVLLLCREADGVFYSPSRLGKKKLYKHHLPMEILCDTFNFPTPQVIKPRKACKKREPLINFGCGLKKKQPFSRKGIYLRGGCCIGFPTSPMNRKRMVTFILLISCQTNSVIVHVWMNYRINILLPRIWLYSYLLLLLIFYLIFLLVIGHLITKQNIYEQDMYNSEVKCLEDKKTWLSFYFKAFCS